MGFLCFRNWDGEGARNYLEQYLTYDLDSYEGMVGEVNLAAALVQNRSSNEATRLLTHLEQQTREEQRFMLLGNVLELRAQLAIHAKDFPSATELLAESARLLEASHHDSLLFTLKWQAVIGLHEGVAESELRLRGVQQKARKMRLWETVRDCDRHLAVYRQNPELLNRLYYGTPFLAFRKILLSEYPSPNDLGESYDWIGGGKRKSWDVLIDLGSWEGEGMKDHLRPGHLIHSLVMVLSADLYSPQKMGTLFGALFPGEYFNPHSSPEKVYKIIQRARCWFDKAGLAVSLEQTAGFYRIRLGDGMAMRLRARDQGSIAKPDKIEHLGAYLHRRFADRAFSAKELSEELVVSQRTVNRLLKEAQAEGWVEKSGKGPATRFHVKKRQAS